MRKDSTIMRNFISAGKLDTCPIVDMHGHLGPFGWLFMPGSTVEGMLQSMDSAGVKAIVCSSHEAIFGDIVRGNSITEEITRSHSGRFYGYWAVNPHYPEIIRRDLRSFHKKSGFLGFKFLSDYHEYPITGQRYACVLDYAEEKEICVLMHTWGFSPFDGPRLVRRVAERYPHVTIIMGHSGYGEWDESIGVSRDHPNVYLDLTAVYVTHDGISLKWCPERNFGVGVNGIIERMVDEAGSDKMLFGTDLPWYSPHYAAGAIVFSGISDTDMHNIFHRNAEKIFAKQGLEI